MVERIFDKRNQMKIKGALHCDGASGTLGDSITFSQRQGLQIARFQRKQKDKITPARSAQREKFLTAKEMWPLQDFGGISFGFNLVGGQKVSASSFPLEKRAPQFALFVSDVLNFYL